MNFSIEKKGYSIEEVDAFLEDLIEKHQRLQAQNIELEQKLATAKRLIRRFSDTENALKQNIADSKRAAAYMISDAKDRSAVLLDSARESCGEIISDLDLQIAQKMETVNFMKAEVSAFKEQLFSLYSSHIEMIDTLAQTAEEFEYIPDYTKVADAVDSFEEAGEPECDSPEFVDYPEESIFAEIEDEKAPVTDEFTLEKADSSANDDEDDFSQLILEDDDDVAVEEDEEDDFALNSEAVTEEIEEDLEFDVAVEEPAGEDRALEEGNEDEDDTDYFKFLADFVNSDEEIDS